MKSKENKDKQTKKKICEVCGGSGQAGCFRGESRFMITWEDCLDCNGTGVIFVEDKKEEDPPATSSDTK